MGHPPCIVSLSPVPKSEGPGAPSSCFEKMTGAGATRQGRSALRRGSEGARDSARQPGQAVPHEPGYGRDLAPRTHHERGRTWLERMLHKVAQRPRCVRFWFEDGPGTGPAKPSGLGMVSCSQHAAGCATEPRKRPAAARFIAGPHRAAEGREPWPWSCGT